MLIFAYAVLTDPGVGGFGGEFPGAWVVACLVAAPLLATVDCYWLDRRLQSIRRQRSRFRVMLSINFAAMIAGVAAAIIHVKIDPPYA